MTDMTASDEKRLTELRNDWTACAAVRPVRADRLAEIEAEAAEIKALHLLRTELGAVVLDRDGRAVS